MNKRGFSFLEVMVAIAILAVLAASLAPLLTGMASTDRELRVRLRAWDAARSRLTARCLDNPKAESEAGPNAFDFTWEPARSPGTNRNDAAWQRLSVVPKNETRPALELTLRTEPPR